MVAGAGAVERAVEGAGPPIHLGRSVIVDPSSQCYWLSLALPLLPSPVWASQSGFAGGDWALSQHISLSRMRRWTHHCRQLHGIKARMHAAWEAMAISP